MKRFIYSCTLLLCQFAFAELNVEWIDDNTIVVTGYGYGDTTNETALGSCTNCLAISPAEMHAIKVQIQNLIDSTLNDVYSIYVLCDLLDDGLDWLGNEIIGFRRFDQVPNNASSYAPLTNYISSVSNTQTELFKSAFPTWMNTGWTALTTTYRYNGYLNGIYDYANQHVSPTVTQLRSTVSSVRSTTQDIDTKLNSISSVVSSITEESCQSCGGGGSTTNCTSSCPCQEQWDALLDYVRHIDEDQHKRYTQLNQISNNVFNIDKQFDSYAKLVSGLLYNDASIVVDDGENSWSNVYRRGYSDLYDYDKSNILQRIELLLFGVSYNTSTNWGDSVDSIDDTFDDVKQNFTDAEDTLRDQGGDLKDDVELIEEKFTAFVNSLNFFGAGHLGEFSLIDPITVFDAYTFDVDSAGFASDLGNLQQVSRTCFQIFYWVSAVLFMVWFWWSFIRFLIDHVFSLVKFFNNLLT